MKYILDSKGKFTYSGREYGAVEIGSQLICNNREILCNETGYQRVVSLKK